MASAAEVNQIISTDLFREKIRCYSRNYRHRARNIQQDSLRFGLGEIRAKIRELDCLTEKDVTGLACRIKRRKHATAEDMYRLCNAFLQDIENIRVFANTPGAMQILAKELTGKDSEQQGFAIETFCNLSLGEPFVCEKLASIAGSYFITYLNSTEDRLKRTSLWTIANILETEGKGSNVMMPMELVPKLWVLYTAENANDQHDYREEAAVCLQLITTSKKHCLRPKDQELICKSMHSKNSSTPGSEYHLCIIFESNIISSNISLTSEQLLYVVNFSIENIIGSVKSSISLWRVVYAIRIISNIIAFEPTSFKILMQQMNCRNTNLVQLLNKIFGFRNDLLTRETLWLVKNVITYHANEVSVSDLVENLKIYTDNLCSATIQML